MTDKTRNIVVWTMSGLLAAAYMAAGSRKIFFDPEAGSPGRGLGSRSELFEVEREPLRPTHLTAATRSSGGPGPTG